MSTVDAVHTPCFQINNAYADNLLSAGATRFPEAVPLHHRGRRGAGAALADAVHALAAAHQPLLARRQHRLHRACISRLHLRW